VVTAVSNTGTAGVATLSGGVVSYNPNGQFDYLQVGETATDTFSYTVSDGHGGFDTATVTVTITGVNDAVDAGDDTATTNEDTAIVVPVLANDVDAEDDSLVVTAVDNTGTTGVASLVGGVDTATVTVTITGVNDAVDAHNDTATTNEDTAIVVPVLANDVDAEDDSL